MKRIGWILISLTTLTFASDLHAQFYNARNDPRYRRGRVFFYGVPGFYANEFGSFDTFDRPTFTPESTFYSSSTTRRFNSTFDGISFSNQLSSPSKTRIVLITGDSNQGLTQPKNIGVSNSQVPGRAGLPAGEVDVDKPTGGADGNSSLGLKEIIAKLDKTAIELKAINKSLASITNKPLDKAQLIKEIEKLDDKSPDYQKKLKDLLKKASSN